MKKLLFFVLLVSYSSTILGQCFEAGFMYSKRSFSSKDTTTYHPLLLGYLGRSGQWTMTPVDSIGYQGRFVPSKLIQGTYIITNTVSTPNCDTVTYSVTIEVDGNGEQTSSSGSNSFDIPATTLQSPNIANFNVMGNVPVSLFTGKPSIQIPLGTIGEKIPVSVDVIYDPTGVKPDVMSSTVGTNWSIQVGGFVSRNVKGFPDDWLGGLSVIKIQGFLNSTFSNGNSYPDPWYETSNIKQVAQMGYNQGPGNTIYDGEPDEYSFQVLGYTGTFYPYYESNVLKWGVRSEKNIKIELIKNNSAFVGDYVYPPFTPHNVNDHSKWNEAYDVDGQYHYEPHIRGFRLTDENGIIYEFDGSGSNSVEYSISFFDQGADTWLPSSWQLTKIKHPDGQEITFLYTRGEFICQPYFNYTAQAETVGDFKFPLFGAFGVTSCLNSSQGSQLGYVDAKLISPVYITNVITDNSSLFFLYENSTSLSFDHSLFQTRFNYQLTHDLRNNSTGVFPPFQWFSYLHTNFYPVYNNPALTIESGNPLSYFIDRLKWKKLKEVQFASRDASFLKKFVFEYNDIPTERLFLQRIKESTSTNVFLPPYEFSYQSGTIPAFLKSHTDHWGYNNNQLFSSNYAEFDASNFVTYGSLYRSPNPLTVTNGILTRITYPTGGYTQFTFEPNNYSKVVSISRNSLESSSNLLGPGLRIQKIENFDSDGTLANRKTYAYSISGTSTGVLSSKWEYYWPFYHLQLSTGEAYYLRKFSTMSLLPHTQNALGAMIGYTSVIETIEGQGRIEYDFTNFDSMSFYDEAPINSLNQAGAVYRPYSSHSLKRGLLRLKRMYNSAGSLISLTDYQYDVQGNFSGSSILDYVKVVDAKVKQYCQSAQELYEGNAYKQFYYRFLPIEITETLYDENNTASYSINFKRFYYKPNGQLSKEAGLTEFTSPTRLSVNYNGSIPIGPWVYDREIHTTYTYPNDYPLDATLSAMTTKNMIALPVETQKSLVLFGGGQFYSTPLQKSKVTYALFNGLFYKPSYVEINYGTSSNWQRPISYLSYNNDGYVTSFSEWGNGIKKLSYFTETGKKGLLKESYHEDGTGNTTLQATQKYQYEHLPLRGVSKITPPSNLYTSFAYDNFGRFSKSFDTDGYLLKKYEYHYQQSSACVPPAAPTISVSSVSVCQNQLTASNCTGIVTWSNGTTGNSLLVPTTSTATYTATCSVSGCTSTPSNSLTVPVLPSAWLSTDIGNPTAGCTNYSSGTLSLVGNGNVYGTSDSFHYVYKQLSGDFTMIAKISSLNNTDGLRGGIMIRSGLTADAQYYSLIQDGNANVGELKRDSNGASGGLYSYHSAPLNQTWIKVVKTGSSIKGYHSTDTNPEANNAWNDFFFITGTSPTLLDFGSNFYVGIGVWGTNNQMSFSNISINGQSF